MTSLSHSQGPAFGASAASRAGGAGDVEAGDVEAGGGLELRRWRRSLLLITLLALALRLAVVWQDTPMVFGGDEHEYVGLAQQMARTGRFETAPGHNALWQGGEIGQATAYRNPILPGFLALHYALLGSSQAPPRFSMALIGALSCLLLGILGRQLFAPRVGLWAAALWTLWPPALVGPYAANRFTPEHLAVVLLLGSSVALAPVFERPQLWRAVVGGLLLGLAILTRGYLLFALPLAFLVLLLRSGRDRWKLSLGFAGAVCLVVGLWVARNVGAVGKPVLSTQTEAFYLGNNRWARGSLNGDVFVQGAQSPQIVVLTRKYPDFWRMSEVERSQMWSREGKAVVLEDPRRALWLAVRKTLIHFSPLQYWSVGFYKHHYAYALALLLLPWGFAACRRAGRQGELWLLMAPVAASYAAALLTYGLDRYHYPIEPFLALLACAGAFHLFEWRFRAPATQASLNPTRPQA